MENKKGQCIKLTVEFEAGSDFQFDHARSLLEGTGTAISQHLRKTHKDNWSCSTVELLEKKSVSEHIKKLEEEAKRFQESYAQDK